jgi:YD repeat-containing protein
VEAFNVPVFESIDQNGVDLITGSLRITTPVMEIGTEYRKETYGLQWSGKGWMIIGRPTVWRDGDKYIVNYRGKSEEFNDRSKNYSQRKPVSGASLSCFTYEPSGITSECLYTDRDGDVVQFKGIMSPYHSYSPKYGISTFAWGNIGMSEASVYSYDRSNWKFGESGLYAHGEWDYYKRDVIRTLGQQNLKITTPNHDSNSDEHYLRPRNTTQSVTDSVGSTWLYTINDNRRLTRIVSPDGAAVNIAYNDGKVASVTNASGTWTYSYTSPGDYGTTTVTNPLGEQSYVKYHRDRGYVTESRDALNRWTYYAYDSGHRPTRITYPEGNYVEYTYDARGNITSKVIAPRPSAGGTALVERAGYDATCADAVLCNQPRWVEDARGGRTDYEYAPTTARPIDAYSSNTPWQTRAGTTKPTTVTSPAVGGVRPQVRTSYVGGLPAWSATCLTQANCAGTADEVVTTYQWANSVTYPHLIGKAVTAGGQILRTCYGYDVYGRMISETPPIAGLTTCPSTAATPPPVTATMPSPGFPAVVPTFPDGTTGSGGGGSGGGGSEPVDPPCGSNGVICP